ncbi:hypothetical protein GCM10009750_11640 [Agromyces salentinus]|uniref:DUF222 domain-containing protein n=1 Tax=Agromyces salentinus TaxID=269421 RepID=A0ABP4YVI9_9MICO
MPDEVEADVAERDVLLELGGARDPHAELLGEHEGVVAEAQRVLRGIRIGDPAGAGDARAGELLGERDLVDRDGAVRAVRIVWRSSSRRRRRIEILMRGLDTLAGARYSTAGLGAHRCFTPSLFV